MKKTTFISLLIALGTNSSAFGALNWWQQPTICRINPADCYSEMGAGFDDTLYDANAGCWGKKLICPDALKNAGNDVIAMGRNEITRGDNIRSDYDIDKLNTTYGDCFGVRKTILDGSMVAKPDGTFTTVWCRGVLPKIDEEVANGEVTFGAAPTCADLARDGWVALKNAKENCYGVQYDLAKYLIQCGKAGLLPNRLIVLNGADAASIPDGGNYDTKDDATTTDKLFDKMEAAARERHAKYFDN